MNPYDRYAIEEAVRIKKKFSGEIIAICMGPASASDVLKQVLALGADGAYLVSDKAFAGADTYATARVLSETIRKIGGIDLVICGKQSTDSSTSQIPSSVAAFLDIIAVNNVVSCEAEKDGIRCRVRSEYGFKNIRVEYPAVLSVNNEINVPKIASVEGLLYSRKKAVINITNSDLGIDESECGLKGSLTRVRSIYDTTAETQRSNIICERIGFDKLFEVIDSFRVAAGEKKDEITEYTFTKNDDRNIMVFLEEGHNNHKFLCKAVSLARELDTNIEAVTLCSQKNISKYTDLSSMGVVKNNIFISDNAWEITEKTMADRMMLLIKKKKPTVVLFDSTVYQRSLAPYIAVKLKLGLTADCHDLQIDDNGRLLQVRSVFGGKKNAEIYSLSDIQITTFNSKIYTKKFLVKGISTESEVFDLDSENTGNRYSCEMTKEEAINFSNDVIIGIGKGVGSKANCKLIANFAKKMNYGICATRAVVDMGWMPYSYQVGITGEYINPSVYIAVGISGAIEHMKGCETSNTIIGINSNKNSDISRYCDYLFVQDSEQFIKTIKEIQL